MRAKGKLTDWNDEKGFGFITPMQGGDRLFVHISAFVNRARRPVLGQVLTYTPATDRQGRACARQVQTGAELLQRKPAAKRSRSPWPMALLFVALVGVLALSGRLPLLAPAYVVAVSLLTWLAYAIDKSAARYGRWRTQESTLLLLGLAGGWPGALLASHHLRHKSSKQSFRVVLRATVLLNCLFLAWLLSSSGQAFLRTLPIWFGSESP